MSWLTVKSNIFLSYVIVSRNDDTRVMLSLQLFVSVESRSIVDRFIGPHSISTSSENYVHYVSCDCIIGIENTELIVTYVLQNKL